jgi:hypothetical protein
VGDAASQGDRWRFGILVSTLRITPAFPEAGAVGHVERREKFVECDVQSANNPIEEVEGRRLTPTFEI